MVTNNDLVLTYEFRVHNEVVASVSYRENFTKAHNMYSNEGLYSLDKDSLAWAMTTTDKFIEDIQKSLNYPISLTSTTIILFNSFERLIFKCQRLAVLAFGITFLKNQKLISDFIRFISFLWANTLAS